MRVCVRGTKLGARVSQCQMEEKIAQGSKGFPAERSHSAHVGPPDFQSPEFNCSLT